MSSVTLSAIRPLAGDQTGPRPNFFIQADVTPFNSPRTIRVLMNFYKDAVFQFSQTTIYRVFPNDSIYSGTFTTNILIDRYIADGAWSWTLEMFQGPTIDYVSADGGATEAFTGNITTPRAFNSRSTSAGTPVSPASGSWQRLNYSNPSQPTNHQQLFSWTFGSNNPLATQGEYTLWVERVDTSAVIAQVTVSSSDQSGILPISDTYKEMPLRWYVRARDQWGLGIGVQSAKVPFTIGTPPVTSIANPTVNQALTSGVININTSATTTGGRTITKADLSIWQGTTKVWERTVSTSLASGANLNVTDSNFVLPQSGTTPYTLKVVHTDSQGLTSSELQRSFTVAYTGVTPANAPTVSAANYDTLGYILIEWPNTGVDSAFYAWAVERRSRPLDPYTGAQIDSFSAWAEVGRVYTQATTDYDYQDFTATSNMYHEYRVQQLAIRDGQPISSTTATAGTGVSAITTAYWLVDLGYSVSGTATVLAANGTALKLWNVVGETFKRERVREEYPLIGRGRYIEFGDKLGASGTLSCQVRDSGGITARSKRLAIHAFVEADTRFLLRNTFGDAIIASIGDIDITRIPGTGKSEFVDITVPYAEVS